MEWPHRSPIVRIPSYSIFLIWRALWSALARLCDSSFSSVRSPWTYWFKLSWGVSEFFSATTLLTNRTHRSLICFPKSPGFACFSFPIHRSASGLRHSNCRAWSKYLPRTKFSNTSTLIPRRQYIKDGFEMAVHVAIFIKFTRFFYLGNIYGRHSSRFNTGYCKPCQQASDFCSTPFSQYQPWTTEHRTFQIAWPLATVSSERCQRRITLRV